MRDMNKRLTRQGKIFLEMISNKDIEDGDYNLATIASYLMVIDDRSNDSDKDWQDSINDIIDYQIGHRSPEIEALEKASALDVASHLNLFESI